jgi:hypothetical protein
MADVTRTGTNVEIIPDSDTGVWASSVSDVFLGMSLMLAVSQDNLLYKLNVGILLCRSGG